MSAATASSADLVIVHVRLLDEAVDVWRPAPATRLGESIHRLSDAAADDESWSYKPGEVVMAERRSRNQEGMLVAIARASDVDERSCRTPRVAG